MDMFCRQCEQTAGGTGCTVRGVCGKTAEVAALQDVLIQNLLGIGIYGHKARELGVSDPAADTFVMEALFTTLTNVDFDPQRIEGYIAGSKAVKENLKKAFLEAYKKKNGKDYAGTLPAMAEWVPDASRGLKSAGVMSYSKANEDNDIRSLRELILYGLKGMAAYADHALILGEKDETVNAFFYKGLAALTNDTLTAGDLTALVMELGKVNLVCMEMLDRANTRTFGDPQPTPVYLGAKKGPAIIVSGHDLLDLKQILEQTEGKGIAVYTHGEMLPAHGYPELKKYRHLAGHFGTAWQNQQKEFDGIPAAILMTTNCLRAPLPSYNDRIFTTGVVGFSGIRHIAGNAGTKDFSAVVQKAVELGGFAEDRPDKSIMTGFGHNALLGAADKIIAAVKSGALKHIFLIGGCDGAKPGRSYYAEFAAKVPKDCVILTLACGKFRFNREEFGTLGGLPRLLDVGQCNDAYSAIKVASALAGAFKVSVNELPLSLILSWYEQKAVCILLTLLSLGMKNIRLGPTLPAFVSPNVLKILVENFQIKPITTADKDLEDILEPKTVS